MVPSPPVGPSYSVETRQVSFTGHMLTVGSYHSLLATSFSLVWLRLAFIYSLLAVSLYLLVRATFTCDL